MWAVSNRLYLGNYWSGEQALVGRVPPSITTGVPEPIVAVVSLCAMPLRGRSLLGPVSASIDWLHFPISDGGLGEGEFAAALDSCLPFVAEKRNVGSVLVHCAAGMSRSVCVVAAVLCSECAGLTVDLALRRIAQAKARAMGAAPEDADLLVAPAWEFRAHLRRRFENGGIERTVGLREHTENRSK